jgi:hypothetical protein
VQHASVDDWISSLLAKLEVLVGFVRRSATDRVVSIMRMVAYGLAIVLVALFVVVLLLIVLIKLLFLLAGGRGWIAYGIPGLLTLFLGLILLRFRHSKATPL